MKRAKYALPIILTAIFLDLICNGIIVPIVPQLLANPGSPYYLLPAGMPISYAYVVLGLLISIFPVFMFFATPVLGEYSDYVGRRKVMTLALTGTALSLGLFAVGITLKSLTLLFVARIIGGIMGGNLSVAQAAIADITPPEKRANRFGLIGAAYGVGFIVGPVIGGILADQRVVPWFSASTPFWFAAALTLMNAVLVWAYLADTYKLDEKIRLQWHRAVLNVFKAFSMRRVRAVFATNFLFQSGIALFATFFSVFLIHSFGFDQLAIGYYIGYVGVWVVICQAVVLPFLTKRYSEVTLLRVFLLAGSLATFAYYIPDRVAGLLVVGACFALTNGISLAALPSLVSCRTPARNQGEVLGINSSVQALAQAVPPVLAGFLAAEITPSAPVYLAGAVIGVGWILFMIFVRKEK